MMHLRSKGLILILSSPSGGGKSSLCRELLNGDINLKLSISVTTRPPRPNEIEGIHYYFKTVEQFKQLIAQNYFLEYAENYDNFYGTPYDHIFESLNNGIDVLFDIDWKGAQEIKAKMPDVTTSIFIMPPNLDILKQRLQDRNQDSEDVINSRMKIAEKEISRARTYDHVVINDDFDKALTTVKSILESERFKASKILKGSPNNYL